ncbi:Na+/solute symporter [Caballeronia hypogeia]|uniref:Na+/solute symporter n=1 Tax=Caballeronia hypogeia TaxID=1777140 RepID=A0A158BRL9_9BURK|nr:sodium:solute symporter family protein [Caballeronia hypogeia]SAK72749.1 Na+/solute symporter [Caballeronia hypogeia]
MLNRAVILISVCAGYFVLIACTGYFVRRHAANSKAFVTGGKHFSPKVIAALLVSESIGTSITVGTAQTGFERGLTAAWVVIALAIGFLLLGWTLVERYRSTGLHTISAILEQNYGRSVRYGASVMTIFSLSIVTVALYAAGGALLGAILGLGHVTATLIVGAVAIFFVTIGGFRSVVYTNTLNAILKYVGVVLALAFALSASGGYSRLQVALPAHMFDVMDVGISKIIAWVLAGSGAMFASQYVIQGVVTVADARAAKRACYYASAMLVPFGIGVALIGLCSAHLYPGIRSIDAFPAVIAHMPAFAASIVVIGLAGALFGGISAATVASSTLLLRDFYELRRAGTVDEKRSLRFIRIATIVMGILPLILALFASKILLIAFLGKALRGTLAVLIVLCFYAPKFGTSRGALAGIVLSTVSTTAWFVAGNPFGIDSSYFAFVSPLVTMTVSHLHRQIGQRRRPPTQSLL